MRAGLAAVPDDATEIVVLNGDIPLLEADLISAVLQARRTADAAISLVTFEAWEPGALGRVIRTPDGEWVARLVEASDATRDELAVSEVNAGLYAFDAAWLRSAIRRLTPSPATGEYYVTQLIDLAVEDGLAVVAREAPDDGALDGINDPRPARQRDRDAARAHQSRLAPGRRHDARPRHGVRRRRGRAGPGRHRSNRT